LSILPSLSYSGKTDLEALRNELTEEALTFLCTGLASFLNYWRQAITAWYIQEEKVFIVICLQAQNCGQNYPPIKRSTKPIVSNSKTQFISKQPWLTRGTAKLNISRSE
jgi:hypothetical protein